jgi:ketosteroid isomerase-like protein
MGSPSPDQTAQLFFERFNSGSAAGFAGLYFDDAIFTYNGQDVAVGPAQIERAVSGFMLAGFQMRGHTVDAYVAGDTALTRVAWEMVDKNGAVVASGTSAEVQRLGPDGFWRFIIDDAGGGSRAP